MRTKTITLYQFDELPNAKAKEKAREWLRRLEAQGFDGSQVTEDAERIAAILGIELQTHEVTLVSGKKRSESNIWWSGFSSQGDGACIEGTYQHKAGSVKAIKSYAPKDAELHRIADSLTQLQKSYNYKLIVEMVKYHGAHYSNEASIDFTVLDDAHDDREIPKDDVKEATSLLQSFMRWIYKQLDAEYTYRLSDEAIDESMVANEYEFDEEGRRA